MVLHNLEEMHILQAALHIVKSKWSPLISPTPTSLLTLWQVHEGFVILSASTITLAPLDTVQTSH